MKPLIPAPDWLKCLAAIGFVISLAAGMTGNPWAIPAIGLSVALIAEMPDREP